MEAYKTMAHIYSLNGAMEEVTIITEQYILGQKIANSFIVDYKGTTCTAFYNEFVGEFYAEDIYGVVAKYEKN